MSINLDAAEMQSLREGEKKVFHRIVEAYKFPLFIFCRRILQDGDAELIVSDTFIALWEKREGMNSGTHVQKFLYQVARNKCIDVLRRRKRKPTVEDIDMLDTQAIDEWQEQQFAQLKRRLYVEEIRESVDTLPDRYRKAILLYLENYSAEEAAELMGVNTRKIYALWAEAKRRLKKTITARKGLGIAMLIACLLGFFLK